MADPQSRNYNFVTSAGSWLANGRRVVPILTLGGIALAVDILAIDVVLNFREAFLDTDPEESLFQSFFFPYLRKLFAVLLLFLLPAFVVSLYRRRGKSFVLPLSFASLALLLLWLPGELLSSYPPLSTGSIREEPSALADIGKIVLIALLIISPPIAALLYHRTSILNRYVLRSFLLPFTICLFSFIAIWFIIDLSDNGPDFFNARSNVLEIGYFYLVQLPQVVVLVMPITILLALLYSLGKMSNSNEVVSMIGAGRSTGQVFAPLFTFSLYATFVCFVLNYEWAPWSEGHKESVLNKIRRGYEQKTINFDHLHHNSVDRRTWFIQIVPFNLATTPMRFVEIREQDEEGRLRKTYYARLAKWSSALKSWRFTDTVTYHYNEDGVPQKIEPRKFFHQPDWRETPFKLISSNFNPEYLGIPELTSFLKTNHDHEKRQLAPFRSHWHYRWSLPWSCLVVTLVAAPLGIVYSRRGLLGSVAGAVFIFFFMTFLEHFFLSLGLGSHIHPFFSAWSNNFLFAGIGSVLFYFRSRNRSLSFPNFRMKKNPLPQSAPPSQPPSTQLP